MVPTGWEPVGLGRYGVPLDSAAALFAAGLVEAAGVDDALAAGMDTAQADRARMRAPVPAARPLGRDRWRGAGVRLSAAFVTAPYCPKPHAGLPARPCRLAW